MSSYLKIVEEELNEIYESYENSLKGYSAEKNNNTLELIKTSSFSELISNIEMLLGKEDCQKFIHSQEIFVNLAQKYQQVEKNELLTNEL